MKRKYLVIYEKLPGNFGGCAPDILGCVSVGDTLEEMRANMKEALEFHFEGTVQDGISIPEPVITTVDFDPKSDDYDPGVLYTVVEWLEVEVPILKESQEESHAGVAAD